MRTFAASAAARITWTKAVSGLSKLNRSAPMISAPQPGRCGSAAAQAETKASGPLSATTRPANSTSRSRPRRRQLGQVQAVGQHHRRPRRRRDAVQHAPAQVVRGRDHPGEPPQHVAPLRRGGGVAHALGVVVQDHRHRRRGQPRRKVRAISGRLWTSTNAGFSFFRMSADRGGIADIGVAQLPQRRADRTEVDIGEDGTVLLAAEHDGLEARCLHQPPRQQADRTRSGRAQNPHAAAGRRRRWARRGHRPSIPWAGLSRHRAERLDAAGQSAGSAPPPSPNPAAGRTSPPPACW